MEKLSELELFHARLEDDRRLLQASDGQMVGGAQIVFVGTSANAAMSSPEARRTTPIGLSIGGKAALRSNKAEGGERGEPVKPLRGIGGQMQLVFL